MDSPTLQSITHTPVQGIESRLLGEAMSGRREWVVPPIECLDGTLLSVQASSLHYCDPRDDDGPWAEVEVGFPSVDPGPEWSPYADEPSKPTEAVYGYVPVEMVEEFIELHGGYALG